MQLNELVNLHFDDLNESDLYIYGIILIIIVKYAQKSQLKI